MSLLTLSVPSRKTNPFFFRDEAVLKSIKNMVRRRRLGVLRSSEPLRVWVPQCSSGEGAYSIAICLLEALGSRWREIPLQVFCTDSNEDALAHARGGRYPAEAAHAIARDKLERFFSHEAGRICVRPFVRGVCRFASHDLSRSPHFCYLDLIVGPDTLARMPAPLRERTLQFFHYALVPGGVLLDLSGTAARSPELFAPAGRGGTYEARKRSGGILPLPTGVDARNVPPIDARLWESEERFRILFSQAEKSIFVLDAVTDRVLDANEAAQRLYGWTLPEFLGMRGKDLVVPPKTVRRPKAERRSEERLSLPHYRRKDGTVFPADMGRTFMMRKGRPCNLLMLQDATERLRKNFGQDREKRREDFVDDVVHELRSPIAVIRGSVESLRRGVRGAKARTEFLKFIEDHTSRMTQLVDKLLDLSTADSSRRETKSSCLSLSATIWEIAAAFISVAKRRGISIKIDIPGELAVVADYNDLPHIIGNLLDNAIKFSPRRGRVFVSGRAEGSEAILSIRDSGGGLTSADLPRIFERFYRSESARQTKGTGLGLSIVQALAKANHGRVVAENHPLGGAVFHLALPLAPATSL